MPPWCCTRAPSLSLAPVASFDFEGGPVTVEIAATGEEDIGDVVVRPLSRGVEPQVEGNVITFQLNQPDIYTVEYNGITIQDATFFITPSLDKRERHR